MREKKLINEIGKEMKKRMPFFSHWEICRGKKIAAFVVDVLAVAKLKNQKYFFCVEAKTAGYPQYIREGVLRLKKFTTENPLYYPIIAVPFISEQGKKICDEYNIGYIDLSGNAKIAYGSIFIYTHGIERSKGTVAFSQSILSPKSARITKFLLANPYAKWIQRDVVAMTGLSKGLVSRVITKMIDAGYVVKKDKKIMLANFDDLFSAWVESEMKRRERKKNYYVWAQNPAKLMEVVADKLSRSKIKYAFTQEAGASLVAPFATFSLVSVYIESLDKFPVKALSASVADKGFNLTVIEASDEYIFMNARDKGGLKVVDNFQLYADIKKNPLRGEEQANHILALIKKNLNEK